MAVGSVANSDTFKTTTPSDREITLTRLFDAPRLLVFDAMTKPEHVRRWWGCLDERYSVPICEIDRPGRLVFTEIYDPFPDAESVVTSVFTEEGGKTRLTVTALYPSLEVRDSVLKTGMSDGAAISYDRLEDLVRELQQ